MKPKGERYTVAVDFDGVIHSYNSPWVNAETIPDEPVEGAIEWLNKIAADFDVVIFTTRGKTLEGRQAVALWLEAYGFEDFREVTAEKVAALIYLDDRAYRFTGHNFPAAQEVHAARPWNKRAHSVSPTAPSDVEPAPDVQLSLTCACGRGPRRIGKGYTTEKTEYWFACRRCERCINERAALAVREQGDFPVAGRDQG